ncbi:MAG: RNA polymerase sporulation sigma factor SigE [Acutalibacteraceae bacterium]|nr:RNA polymerase sporulation sigma factor SigE [Acutalibacteraceae bacterium]
MWRNFGAIISRITQKLRESEGIYYINGPETLPPPLKKDEEAAVMQRIENGDKKARELLIIHNLRLVVYIAKKFESPSVNVEDLISIGTIGLIKAVNTFCPSRNIKLATYASRCIENEILMYFRKNAQQKNEISIDEPLNVDWDGNELLISDILGSDSDVVNRRLEKESETKQLMEAVSRLNKRELTIMELRFGLNGKKAHTQKQVADLLGISQSYISRLEKKIISRLKEEITQE